LLKEHKTDMKNLMLIPGDGGCFEVKRDGKLLYSKLASDRFPEDGEIAAIISGDKEPVLG
jgi:selT/selW/selH-like putative selenoprotein